MSCPPMRSAFAGARSRLAFPFGTRLVAGDLTEATGYEPGLLGLHARGAHGSWGVAQGLAATVGVRNVGVEAGIAFDCHGAALVLDRTTFLTTPGARGAGASPGGRLMDVVLERAPTCAPEAPACEGAEPARLLPVARLAWRAAGAAGGASGCADTANSTAVPLARVRIDAAGTLTRVAGWSPPRARSLARPRLGRGTASGGDLRWFAGAYDLRARIDTTAAAFSTTPAYIVSVPRPLAGVVVGPFARVAGASPRGFWLRVLFATRQGAPALDTAARRDLVQQLTFSWLGVEIGRSCPPSPATLRATTATTEPPAGLGALPEIFAHLGLVP